WGEASEVRRGPRLRGAAPSCPHPAERSNCDARSNLRSVGHSTPTRVGLNEITLRPAAGKRTLTGDMSKMTPEDFLAILQAHAATFAKAVATNEGEWIIKGFIDIYKRIYTISVDTKIVSKVLELLLFPMFVQFGTANGLKIELCPQQNFYPDLTFTHEVTGRKF